MNGPNAKPSWWRRLFLPRPDSEPTPPARSVLGGVQTPSPLSAMLVPDGLVVWDAPVPRDEVVETLVDLVAPRVRGLTAAAALRQLRERDALGSTAVGQGIDLPHARIEGVARPAFAIGLTRGGLSDVPAPGGADAVEVVWLLLLPPGGAGLGPTAQVARACRDQTFRAALRRADAAHDVRTALSRWELAQAPPAAPWST